MRFLCVFSLAFAIVYSASIKLDTWNLVECDSKFGDVVLVDSEIYDEGHSAGLVDIIFRYPAPGNPQDKVINCVMVRDLKPDQGSKVEILEGGLGFRNVSLHFTSDFRSSVDFAVVLMGQ